MIRTVRTALSAAFLLALASGWAAAQSRITSIVTLPAGTTGQIQFKTPSGFGGDSDLTFSTITNLFTASSGAFTVSLKIPTSTASVTCASNSDFGKIAISTFSTSGQQIYVCEGASGWKLQGDGSGSGGGTPGGSDTEVQFNDSGSFNGDSGLTYDKVNIQLAIHKSAGDMFRLDTTGFGANNTGLISFTNFIGTTEGYLGFDHAGIAVPITVGPGFVFQGASGGTTNSDEIIRIEASSPYRVALRKGSFAFLSTSTARYYDADSSNYVSFRAANSVGSNIDYILPATDASGCWQSNGSGVLSIGSCGSSSGSGYSLEPATVTIGANQGINISTINAVAGRANVYVSTHVKINGTLTTGSGAIAITNTTGNLDGTKVANADLGDISVLSGVWSLDANTVGTTQIIDSTITVADMGPNSVGGTQIIDSTITSADLGTDSVGATQLSATAILPGDIGSDDLPSLSSIAILITNTLQAGATFFVSSGTANSFTIGTLSGVLKQTNGVIAGGATTSDVPEGTNQYFTIARTTGSFSATAPISYSNGVIGAQAISLSSGVTGTLQLQSQTSGIYIASVNATAPITVTSNGLAGSTITLALTQNAGTDITADLEEETHGSEHQFGAADSITGVVYTASTDTITGAKTALSSFTFTSTVAFRQAGSGVMHINSSSNVYTGQVSLSTEVTGTIQATNFPALTGAVSTQAGSLTTSLAGNLTNYAQITNTLQPNTTIYVTSATVSGPLSVATLTITGQNTGKFTRLDSQGRLVSTGPVELASLEKDPSQSGVINTSTNPVDWTQLKNVPAGFSDGTDDGASGGSGYALEPATVPVTVSTIAVTSSATFRGPATALSTFTYANLGWIEGLFGGTTVQIFTATGTYTPGSRAERVLVILTGAGGTGRICDGTDETSGGGGGGGTAIKMFKASDLRPAIPVNLPAAATAENTASASTLGTSTMTANAGGLAVSVTSTTVGAIGDGGAGGTASGGDINITGGDGGNGLVFSGTADSGGNGGPSFWGGGGRGGKMNAGTGQNGNAGTAYGSGGGGCIAPDTSDFNSGTGAGPVAYFIEFGG